MMRVVIRIVLAAMASLLLATEGWTQPLALSYPSPTYNNVNIFGNATIGGALGISGAATFSGGMAGTLTGHATLDLPLTGGNVSGDSTFSGSGTGLTVTNNTSLSNATTTGTLGVGTNLSVGGNSNLTGTLGVTGNTSLSNATTSGTLGVGTNTTIGGTLGVTGAATFAHDANRLNVRDYGAVGNGTTNDATALQAAATACPTAGCTLYFPPGYSFGAGAPVYLKSNTHVIGYGATVVALSGITIPANGGVISNQHYNASTLTDSNITIEGLTVDFGSSGLDGNYHFLQFNYVSHVQVLNGVGYGRGGGDYVANIGNVDVLEQGNVTSGFSNIDYDHWGGTSDVRVIGNYSTSPYDGVFFDATLTGSDALTAANLVVSGNIFPTGGILLDTLASGGVVTNVLIEGNTLQWVIGRGTVTGTKVVANTFLPAATANVPVIWIDQGATAGGGFTGNPSNTTLIGNVFNSPNVSSLNEGAVRVYGGGVLSNNSIVNSGSPNYTYPLILEGSTPFYGSANQWPAGSSGGVIGSTIGVFTDTNTLMPNGGLGYQQLDANGAAVRLVVQADNNVVLYSTTASGASIPVISVAAHSNSPIVNIPTPMGTNGGAIISSGTGAPGGSTAGVGQVGSLYLRTDGASGTHLYVSQGGSWTAVSGV